jgi:predicted RNA-binding protein associated with RNAse of E/G family
MKLQILDTISDLCTDFLYYDRKEDENLPVGEIERAVKSGEITVEEMVEAFRKELQRSFGK